MIGKLHGIVIDCPDPDAPAGFYHLGATRLEGGGDNFRVFVDPIGHPCCLVEM